MKLLECVPNVSEGRNAETIDACANAVVAAGATLADRSSDAAHHRSVLTYFATPEVAVHAALALARVAAARVDLRTHAGEHPRLGALDVLPFVPLGSATIADAVEVARRAAQAIWNEVRIPSFFYGDAALRDEYRTLPAVRRGGFEGLPLRERADVGSSAFHATAGAIAIGVRSPLIAFNVVLASGDLQLARKIARTLRESDGGLRSLRALAMALDPQHVQVSCNVTDPHALPLDRLVELVRRLAALEGVTVARSELVGLLPRAAVQLVAARALGLDGPVDVAAPC